MNTLVHDIRYATRSLLKSPGFTATAVIILALGIGANSVMFSAVNAMILHPVSFRDPSRLMVLWESNPHIEGFMGQRLPVRLETYIRWEKDAHSFEDMATYRDGLNTGDTRQAAVTLTGIGKAERVEAAVASTNFFKLLGVGAWLGRTFASDESEPGRNRVVILSHGLYQRLFGGNRASLLALSVRINGLSYQIIGVLPEEFHLPATNEGFSQSEPELWTPMNIDPQQPKELQVGNNVLGRLKRGVSLAQARSELQVIEARLRAEKPEEYRDYATNVYSVYTENISPTLRRSLVLLELIVGFVLLIACANIANLLLTRAASRENETLIRVALGAPSSRLIREMLIEGSLLSIVGGCTGLLLAWCGIRAVRLLAPPEVLGLHILGLDSYVLTLAIVVTLLTGLLVGLVPAVLLRRKDIHVSMGRHSRVSSGRIPRKLRYAMAVTEIALAVIPMTGAGLMLRTLHALLAQDPGFRPEHVLTARISLPGARYSSVQQMTFCTRLLESLTTIPGVQVVALASGLPMHSINVTSIHLPGEYPTAFNRTADYQNVSEDYFEAMDSPLVRGRSFSRVEAEQAAGVAVVNQALALQLWPGQNPIGKVVYVDQSGVSTLEEIVGEVPNSLQISLAEGERPQLYLPRRNYGDMSLVVRSSGDPMTLVPEISQAVATQDKDIPVYDVQALTKIVGDSVAEQRFSMYLLIAFAGLALTLSSTGLYGVLVFMVKQRTRELGVRMAMGAHPSSVVRLILQEGIVTAAAGLGFGILGSLVLAKLMSTLLFGVKSNDAITFLAILVVVALVAVVASYLPARQASKIDPMVALRY